MASPENIDLADLEAAIIAIGSFLYNGHGTLEEVDRFFLEDIILLIETELSRREAQLH